MLDILNASRLRMVRGGWLFIPELAMSIAANSAPTGSNLTYNVNEGVEINYNLLAGFTDADGDPLKISLVGITHAGTGVTVPVNYANNPWGVTADGVFYYTANMLNLAVGETTTDIFEFRVWDGMTWSPLQVTVNVQGTGTAIAAPADYAVAAPGVPVVLPVLDNDSSMYAGPLFSPPVIDAINGTSISAGGSVNIMNGVELIGTVSLSGANGVEFTPVAGFSGTASFSYHVSYAYYPTSGDIGVPGDYTQTATVTVVPQSVGQAPLGYDDGYYLVGGSEVHFDAASGVLFNDYPNGLPMLAQLVSGPTNGTLDFNADGSFTFTPHIGAPVTSTQFSYQVANAYTQDPDIINVTLNFTGTATAVNDSFTIDEDTPLTITAAGLFGADGTGPSNDTTPSGSFTGIRIDALPFTGSLWLNGMPVAAGTDISIADIHANKLVYVPQPNGSGQDGFSYRAIVDGVTYSTHANVSILVNPVNDVPTTSNNTIFLLLDEGETSGNINLMQYASDPDDSPLAAQLVSVTSVGYNAGISSDQSSNVFDFNANGTFTYDTSYLNIPDGQTLTEVFTYKIWDGTDYTTANVFISVNGNASGTPTVTGHNDFVMTPQGQAVTLDVFANDPRDSGYESGSEQITTIDSVTVGPASGSFSFGDHGNLVFTPTAGFTGLASANYTLRYTINGGGGEITDAYTYGTMTVRVLPDSINAAPDGVADTYDIVGLGYFGGSSNSVLVNDIKTPGEAHGARLTVGPSEGTLDFHADGSFNYVASDAMMASAPGTEFTVNFSYRAFNGTTEDSNDTLVTLNLIRPYSTPVVVDDTIIGSEGQTLTITPEALFGADGAGPVNDSQAEGQAFSSIIIYSLPADGNLKLNGNPVTVGTNISVADLDAGKLLFVPDGDFSGTTSFAYQVISVDSGVSMPATVTLQFAGTNDAPVYVPSFDPPNVIVAEAADASAQIFNVPGGTMTFTDADSTNLITNISLAQASLFLPGQGGPIAPDPEMMAALTAAYGNALSVSNASFTPSGGGGTLVNTLQFNSLPANLDFLPATGALRLEYTVVVSDGETPSIPITRLVLIEGSNDGPQAADDLHITTENMPVAVDAANGVLSNDIDPDISDTLSVTGVSFGAMSVSADMPLMGEHGMLIMQADGSYVYNVNPGLWTLGLGEFEEDAFTYTISDGYGGTDTATLTIRIEGANQPPVTNPDVALLLAGETVERTAATGVLSTDFDMDVNDTLSVAAVAVGDVFDPDSDTAVTGPTMLAGVYGTLTIHPDGAWSYVADNAAGLGASESANDYFTYVARDNHGAESPGLIQILVTGVNDAPVAAADDYATVQGMPLSVPAFAGLLDNDSDPDGDSLRVSGVGTDGIDVNITTGSPGVVQGTYGTLTLRSDGSFDYLQNTQAAIALAQGEPGEETFSYEIRDPYGLPSTATLRIEIAGQNDGPDAADDTASVNAGATLAGSNVLGNDSDPDTDTLRVSAIAFSGAPQAVAESGSTVIAGQHGTLTIDASGAWSYQANAAASTALDAGEVGLDTFTYTLADSHGAIDTASLAITIDGQNDAPLALADSYTVMQGLVLDVDADHGVLDNDSDPDIEELSAVLVTNAAHGTVTLNADGSFSYTAANGYTGADSFIYRASDGSATSELTQVNITVQPQPVVLGNKLFINEISVNAGAATVTINTNNGALPDKVTTGVARIELFNFSPSAISAGNLANVNLEVANGSGRLSVLDLGSLTGLTSSAAGGALAGTAIQANGSLVLYEPNSSGIGIWQTYSSSGALLLSGTYQDSAWQLGSSVAAPVAVNLAEGAASIDFFAANGAPLSGLVDPQGSQTALTGVSTAAAPHALGAVSPFILPDLSSSWFGGAQLGAGLTLPADVAALLSQNAQFNASLAASTDTVFARSYDHYLAATGGSDDVFVDHNDAGDWTYGRATMLTLGKENTVMSGTSAAFVANALDASDNINPLQGRGPAAHGNLIAGITNEDGQTIAVYSGTGMGGAGHDFLYGVATNDNLQGNGGNDYLYGDGGKDSLTGGSGGDWLLGGGASDTLLGGSGADRLTGGSTGDLFVYLQTSDSLASASDIITDFARNADVIDLSAIDGRASSKFAGNQAFGWAGNTASTVAYSVSWSSSGGNTIVRMDNTGDTTADMVIVLNGIVTLASTDFVL